MPCHDFAPEKEKIVGKKFPYPLRNDPDAYISPHFFPEKKKKKGFYRWSKHRKKLAICAYNNLYVQLQEPVER